MKKKTQQTKSTLKSRLSDFLKKLPDEPPERNYARAHKNTLNDVLRKSPVEEILRRGSPFERITWMKIVEVAGSIESE